MIIVVNKPSGPTSFDIVRKVKDLTGDKKVGHAGTL
ncbi:MAG TPA: tRNA pseudouridine(55) synthase TruB, partial [Gammaproteobacteria bacterium]|nr:tRNA pseudouridine(55) synthase TruB [Gammaproteobacteria bacterium]